VVYMLSETREKAIHRTATFLRYTHFLNAEADAA
jgi:hypothetical protein